MKRIVSFLLAMAIVLPLFLASCGNESQADQVQRKEPFRFEVEENQDETALQIDNFTGIENMKLYGKSENLEFYFNEESLNFAVKNTLSGETWYSSPLDDPANVGIQGAVVLSERRALVTVELEDTTQIIFNSFDNAVKQGTFNFSKTDNGVRIELGIGEKKVISAKDLPQVVEKEIFEKEILEKIKDEKIKSDFENKYTLYLKGGSNVNSKVFETVAKAYPVIRNKDVYIVDATIAYYIAERMKLMLNEIGYDEGKINAENQKNGVSLVAEALKRFDFEVILGLENGRFVANLDCSRVYPDKTLHLKRVRFLDNFGAVNSRAADSFMLLPDGSGALININKSNPLYSNYEVKLYGTDPVVPLDQKINNVEQAVLPVFGIKTPKGAFTAVIEEGASVGSLGYTTASSGYPYSVITPVFDVIEIGNIDAGYSGVPNAQIIKLSQQQPYNKNVKISYDFMTAENANLNAMAQSVRKNLEDRGLLIKKNISNTLPFLLETIGSVDKNSSFLGIFPQVKQFATTTYSQAEEMVKKLKSAGVSNVNLRYLGLFSDGMYQKSPEALKLEKSLGSKEQLEQLKKLLGGKFYADVNILNVKDISGFDTKKNAARALGDTVAPTYTYDLSTGNKYSKRSGAMLYPKVLEPIVNNTLNKSALNQFEAISLADLGSVLYSDFRKKGGYNRQDALDIIEKALQTADQNKSLMINTPNLYSWKYADMITGLPMDSSRYKKTDLTVPFVQMVLHGYVEYAGLPINNSYDYKYEMLRSVSFGAAVDFRWIGAPSSTLSDSYYNENMSACYEDWIDKATAFYQKAAQALNGVLSEQMTGYEQIGQNVFCTTYSNGTKIYVNYAQTAFEQDGISIPAQDFIAVQGGAQA